jgi:ABC-type branched-subunit amino acid transport system substrate-binding protein
MVVHSVLPDSLTLAVGEVLAAAGVAHVAHGDDDPIRAAGVAASDDDAIALIGPFRSADVAEAVEATAPAGLPLIAPVATWAGVTRATIRRTVPP